MKNYITLTCIGVSLLMGCQKTPETLVETETLLDQQLAEALGEGASRKGASSFLLPNSGDLSAIPQDLNNPLSEEKVALGKLLYHETGLAIKSKYLEGMRTYSCASCHHAQAGFQAGIRQGIADGGVGFGVAGEGRQRNILFPVDSLDIQPLRTPSTLNSAYQIVQLWNGQFGATGPNTGTESQWKDGTPIATNYLGFEGVETQAIAGLRVHRMDCDTSLIFNTEYKQRFDQAFSNIPAPERYKLKQAGLAIAAYERTLLANQSPFQRYLRGEKGAMSEHQKQGALLFFGKANCVNCHSGPALNSMEFYAIGMGDLLGEGVHRGKSDDLAHRGRGSFTGKTEDDYKFKVPQLYNLKDSPFYGHGGTFRSVQEVIEYKNQAVAKNRNVPKSQLAEELTPLNLSEEEVQQLTDFVENALYDPDLLRYVPEQIPSGLAFPNNDEQSRQDLGFGG
ncbi:MAG: cytochrome c peroxidase [Bacteroidota bacterium]